MGGQLSRHEGAARDVPSSQGGSGVDAGVGSPNPVPSQAAQTTQAFSPTFDKEPGQKSLSELDLNEMPDESHRPVAFTMYDIFYWRDAPDWYYKTFQSAGMGFSYLILRQYFNMHEMEVYLPPRSKILPESMQRGYRRTQMMKIAIRKIGIQTTVTAALSAVFYGGSYYLGKYRGGHDWSNFIPSGIAAGIGGACYVKFPPQPLLLAFGMTAGALGATPFYLFQSFGMPLFDDSHDFQGWWMGRYYDNVTEKRKEAKLEAMEAEALAGKNEPATASHP